MEGGWRDALRVVGLVTCWALVLSGCGESASTAVSPGAVTAKHPGVAFAPVVLLDRNEPWRPMSARWFIERAVFWFAEDQGCADRKIAVGHTLPEQQNPTIDWIFPKGLGGWSWAAYFRNPHDARCELDFDVRVDANQHTRPHDRLQRPVGLGLGEGFYLDLVDAARSGPRTPAGTPVYVERQDEGDSQVRLTYWLLYGMNAPVGRPAATHEGDWERVDVLLAHEGGDHYLPNGVQLGADEVAPPRDVPWRTVRRAGDTHPIVVAQRGSHRLSPESHGDSCTNCVPWRTWQKVKPLRRQLWYGFGGAWGEPGPTSATTGPLGPHPPVWPTREKQEAASSAAVLAR